ncbi:MAG: RDD family protein [Deltaproteobacteria bacterium]|nr:RDD family protein [Deltaproteobacteria bacterium]
MPPNQKANPATARPVTKDQKKQSPTTRRAAPVAEMTPETALPLDLKEDLFAGDEQDKEQTFAIAEDTSDLLDMDGPIVPPVMRSPTLPLEPLEHFEHKAPRQPTPAQPITRPISHDIWAKPEANKPADEELDALFTTINKATIPSARTTAAPESDDTNLLPRAQAKPIIEEPPTPKVAPTVMEFGDDDEHFQRMLDEMIGDETLDVEAVKVKPAHPRPSDRDSEGSFSIVDGDMEISFEIEIDGETIEDDEDTPEEDPEGEHDESPDAQDEADEPERDASDVQAVHHIDEESEVADSDVPESTDDDDLSLEDLVHEFEEADEALDELLGLDDAESSVSLVAGPIEEVEAPTPSPEVESVEESALGPAEPESTHSAMPDERPTVEPSVDATPLSGNVVPAPPEEVTSPAPAPQLSETSPARQPEAFDELIPSHLATDRRGEPSELGESIPPFASSIAPLDAALSPRPNGELSETSEEMLTEASEIIELCIAEGEPDPSETSHAEEVPTVPTLPHAMASAEALPPETDDVTEVADVECTLEATAPLGDTALPIEQQPLAVAAVSSAEHDARPPTSPAIALTAIELQSADVTSSPLDSPASSTDQELPLPPFVATPSPVLSDWESTPAVEEETSEVGAALSTEAEPISVASLPFEHPATDAPATPPATRDDVRVNELANEAFTAFVEIEDLDLDVLAAEAAHSVAAADSEVSTTATTSVVETLDATASRFPITSLDTEDILSAAMGSTTAADLQDDPPSSVTGLVGVSEPLPAEPPPPPILFREQEIVSFEEMDEVESLAHRYEVTTDTIAEHLSDVVRTVVESRSEVPSTDEAVEGVDEDAPLELEPAATPPSRGIDWSANAELDALLEEVAATFPEEADEPVEEEEDDANIVQVLLDVPEESEDEDSVREPVDLESAIERSIVIVAPELWKLAESEIEQNHNAALMDGWELATTDIFPITRSPERDLLFEIVEEEIVNPGSRLVIEGTTLKSAERTIDNAELSGVFENVSRFITPEDLNPRTAFAARPRQSSQSTVAEPAAVRTYRAASAGLRIMAALLDVGFAAVFTVVLAMISFLDAETKSNILQLQAPTILEVLAHVGGISILYFGVWTISLALMTAGRGQSFGQKVVGIRVLNHAGHEPTLSESFLRVLAINVAVVSFGIAAAGILHRRRRAIQDHLSGTVVALDEGYRTEDE